MTPTKLRSCPVYPLSPNRAASLFTIGAGLTTAPVTIPQHTGQGATERLVALPNVGPAAHLRTWDTQDGVPGESSRADHSRASVAFLVAQATLAITETRVLLQDSWRAVSEARLALRGAL